MLIYFSLRDSDLIGSLKRKISEGKGKTKQQGGDGNFRPAEKFFEYKTNAGGAAEGGPAKEGRGGKSPGCSYQFYWLGRMIYGEVLAPPSGGPENNHGEFDPGSE